MERHSNTTPPGAGRGDERRFAGRRAATTPATASWRKSSAGSACRFAGRLLLGLVLLVGVTACEEEILEISPNDRVDLEVLYSSPGDAEAGLLGVYENVLRSWSQSLMRDLSLSAYELYDASRGLDNRPVNYRPALRVDNDGGSSALWIGGYAAIAQANLAIEKIPEINPALFGGSPRQRETVAEAKFLRAWLYYHLVQLYGDVPLVLAFPTTSEPVANQVTRTPSAEVWAQIRADLTDATEDLPLNHLTIRTFTFDEEQGPLNNTKGRATKNAARLLLARVHLRFAEWQQAADVAGEVIASGEQRLVEDWTLNFDNRPEGSQRSAESIWESIAYRLEFDNTGGYFFTVETSGRASGTPDNAYAVFDAPADDVRAGWSLIPSTDPRRFTAAKFYNRGGGYQAPDKFNFVFFRLAEAYLTRAEALNELGYPNAEALALINALRARAAGNIGTTVYAGIPPATFATLDTQEKFRQFIRDERFRELMFEGTRFYDLRRYDSYDGGDRALRATFLDDPTVPGADPGKILLPIPARDLRVNPNLTQNPPYSRG